MKLKTFFHAGDFEGNGARLLMSKGLITCYEFKKKVQVHGPRNFPINEIENISPDFEKM